MGLCFFCYNVVMILEFLIGGFVFLFGVCVGSFLNCYIYRRLPASAEGFGEARAEKSLKGRSFCPHCKHTLGWQDLFPVFSFLVLGGECRYCKAKISWQYPIVEIVTGVLFLLIFNFQFPIFSEFSILQFANLGFLFYVASALVVIFIYDLKHFIIPDKVLFPAIVITALYRLFETLSIGSFIGNCKLEIVNLNQLGSYVLAVIIAAGFFLAIFLISKGKWMGFGDVKLAVLMGLLLGFSNVLVALFLAFFFGAIIGVILMLLDRRSLKSEIPFGPFLIIGTFFAMLWGEQIIQWYLNFFKI